MSEREAIDSRSLFSQAIDVDAFNASQRGDVYGHAPAMTAERFAQHVARNAIDLSRSPRWSLGGALCGVALLAFRGERAWLGGFGVLPEFRGRGFARRYLKDVLEICRDGGATTLELEVLMRNAPAIALYKGAGFAIVDELVVWSRGGLGASSVPAAACVRDEPEIARMTRSPSACWQREPQSVAAVSPRECVVIAHAMAHQAYAFMHRTLDRTSLLDVGARDTPSAERLLAALDAVAPEGTLVLINEPAHGPLHEVLAANARWTETTRQHRMRRSV